MMDGDLTKLQEGAAQMKEVFDTLVSAGFTNDQALQLLIAMIRPRPETS